MKKTIYRAENEILIVGERYALGIFADAFMQKGIKPRLIAVPSPIPFKSIVLPVFIGNGDSKERVQNTMGKDLADRIWRFSQVNYERAKDFLLRYSIATQEEGMIRWEEKGPQREVKGFAFNPKEILNLIQPDHSGEIERIDTPSHLNVQIKLKNESTVLKSPVVILVDELTATTFFPLLRDKVIPVTLSTFTYPTAPACPQFSISLHNHGADFAIRCGKELSVGSYRGLYEDKAVGIHKTVDPVSEHSSRLFFGGLKWLDDSHPPKISLTVEAVSCDGLPVVGSMPEAPGVFIVGGFSGRTNNYIFETANTVAEGILTNGMMRELESFSLKRFS